MTVEELEVGVREAQREAPGCGKLVKVPRFCGSGGWHCQECQEKCSHSWYQDPYTYSTERLCAKCGAREEADGNRED